MKKRIISFILAFSLCSTFFVLPASALSVFSFSPGVNIYLSWDDYFESTSSENYSDHICNSYWARSHYVEYTYQSLSDWCLQNNLNQDDTGYYFSVEPLSGTAFYGIRILYKVGTFGGGRGGTFGAPRVHADYNKQAIAWLCDNSGNAVVASYDPQVPDIVVVNDTAIDRIRNSRYHLISYDSYLDKLNDPLTIDEPLHKTTSRNIFPLIIFFIRLSRFHDNFKQEYAKDDYRRRYAIIHTGRQIQPVRRAGARGQNARRMVSGAAGCEAAAQRPADRTDGSEQN